MAIDAPSPGHGQAVADRLQARVCALDGLAIRTRALALIGARDEVTLADHSPPAIGPA